MTEMVEERECQYGGLALGSMQRYMRYLGVAPLSLMSGT